MHGASPRPRPAASAARVVRSREVVSAGRSLTLRVLPVPVLPVLMYSVTRTVVTRIAP